MYFEEGRSGSSCGVGVCGCGDASGSAYAGICGSSCVEAMAVRERDATEDMEVRLTLVGVELGYFESAVILQKQRSLSKQLRCVE